MQDSRNPYRMLVDMLRLAQTDPEMRALVAAASNAQAEARARGVPVDVVLDEIAALAEKWHADEAD